MTIGEEALQIQSFLDIECSENPEEVLERIRTIMPYISRTAFMLAEAKKSYRRKRASEIGDTIIKIAKEQFLSAKAQNALLDSIAEEEAYFVDWLDRLNAAATHQVDALRSILSYERESLRLNKSGY